MCSVDISSSSKQTSEVSEKENNHEEIQTKKIRYPFQIIFIIITEACERFSFYGMNTILTLYLIEKFKQTKMDDDEAKDLSTVLFHLFKVICYFSPLFGAALADSVFGKFRTIFYLGLVYAVGQIVLSFGAVSSNSQGIENFPNLPISFIGIFLIGIGTGGIKPCVVSLGADQFKVPEQKPQMTTYFAIFYAAINLGSLISTILTPYLRKVPCMGEDSCFTLAFGVPAGLMIIALVVFLVGKPLYTIVVPERNILVDSLKCIQYALTHRGKKPAGGDWLDAAKPKYGETFCQDLKAVFRVGAVFLMYPMYWALYDQQGSRWTIQATNMNGNTFGFQILPDQIQVANPVLILILIPLFDKVFYPLLGKCNLLKTPLQRIVTGCFLVAVAFTISGILELQLKDAYPVLPKNGEARLTIHNGMRNPLQWTSKVDILGTGLDGGNTFSQNIPQGEYAINGTYGDKSLEFIISLSEKEMWSVIVLPDGRVYKSTEQDHLEKDDNGYPYIRPFLGVSLDCLDATLKISHENQDQIFSTSEQFKEWEPRSIKTFGEHTVSVICKDGSQLVEDKATFEFGGSYHLYVLEGELVVFTLTPPNLVHIFWILPQYLVITMGEILFSITSLEFAYSQAPKSMKSIMQALYYLTTAMGNLITLLVVEIVSAVGLEQWIEFFLFSGMLALCSLALMLFTIRYKYVYYTDDDEVTTEEITEKSAVD